MDREQAIAMLKELVSKNLVEPSYVDISERIPNHYQIQLKCDYSKMEIVDCAKKIGLTVSEDENRKYLVIFKP